MSSFECKCGERLSDNSQPDPNANYTISEIYLSNETKFGQNLQKYLKENPKMIESWQDLEQEFFEEIYNNSMIQYECPKCNRIHIQKEKNKWDFQSYIKETS